MKAFVICLLIGGSGIGYVWQKEQIVRLGQQIKARETRLIWVEGQNDKLRKQLAQLRSPGQLEVRIKELNLGLLRPLPGQVWRLPEPLTDAPVRPPDGPYALQANRGAASP